MRTLLDYVNESMKSNIKEFDNETKTLLANRKEASRMYKVISKYFENLWKQDEINIECDNFTCYEEDGKFLFKALVSHVGVSHDDVLAYLKRSDEIKTNCKIYVWKDQRGPMPDVNTFIGYLNIE